MYREPVDLLLLLERFEERALEIVRMLGLERPPHVGGDAGLAEDVKDLPPVPLVHLLPLPGAREVRLALGAPQGILLALLGGGLPLGPGQEVHHKVQAWGRKG